MSRILVTGATGFIGRALVPALAKDGHAVRIAVRRPASYPLPGVEVAGDYDLAQPVDWQRALDDVDQVIHLAGIAHTGSVAANMYDRINRQATEHLAKAGADAGIRRFVFVSSLRAQSGPAADHILTERDPPAPTDAYGRSKLAAEQAVGNAGVPFTVLRPAVLYGPGAKANVALLARVAALPIPLPLQSFDNRRSLLGIDNFISAVRFVLSASVTSGETYIVADPGIAPRLSEVMATLRRAQGRRPLLFPMPPGLLEAGLRFMGRTALWERIGSNLEADAGKLIAAGWQPAHDTATGLAAMVRGTMLR
jgi:nucleoside-diphosphate-sugar epimerase